MTLKNSIGSRNRSKSCPEKRLSKISEEIEAVIVKIAQSDADDTSKESTDSKTTEVRTEDRADARSRDKVEDRTEAKKIRKLRTKEEIHEDIKEEISEDTTENRSITVDEGHTRENSIQMNVPSGKIGKTLIGIIIVAGIGSFIFLEMTNREIFVNFEEDSNCRIVFKYKNCSLMPLSSQN